MIMTIIVGFLIVSWTPAGLWVALVVGGAFLLWVGYHLADLLWQGHLLNAEIRDARRTTPAQRHISWESLQRSRPHPPTDHSQDTAEQVTAILQSVAGTTGSQPPRPGR